MFVMMISDKCQRMTSFYSKLSIMESLVENIIYVSHIFKIYLHKLFLTWKFNWWRHIQIEQSMVHITFWN